MSYIKTENPFDVNSWIFISKGFAIQRVFFLFDLANGFYTSYLL